MPEQTELTEKKICDKCGRVHEVPLDPAAARGDEWKVAALSVAGIVFIVMIWIWVFKWGVPLVKQLSGNM